jgi:NADH:ubiquinone oxidoreductase subunit D
MEIFNLEILDGLKSEDGYKYYLCPMDKFRQTIFDLGSNHSYLWLLGIDNYQLHDKNYLCYYFYDFESDAKFSLVTEVVRGGILYSIANLWSNATEFEAKILSEFSLSFYEEYKFRPPKRDIANYLERFNIEKDLGLDGSCDQLEFTLKDNLIFSAKLQRGLHHIGLQDMLCKMDLGNAYITLENYFGIQGGAYLDLVSNILEQNKSIKVPDRAKAIRMVILELQRILGHLLYCNHIARVFENNYLFHHNAVWMRNIQALLVSYSGNACGHNTIRYGGVAYDVNQTWNSRVIDELTLFQGDLQRITKNLMGLRESEHNLNLPLVSKKEIFNWSLSGPLARCGGVNLDLRKRQNKYFYSDVDFDVPVGVKGTLFDYIMVRIEEAIQSAKIIVQVLDNLPTGRILSTELDYDFLSSSPGEDEEFYRSSVANFLNVRSYEGTQVIESDIGILGVGTSIGAEKKNYFHVFGSHFSVPKFFESKLIGKEFEEIRPLWHSLNLSLKEVEL